VKFKNDIFSNTASELSLIFLSIGGRVKKALILNFNIHLMRWDVSVPLRHKYKSTYTN